ncbi:MAG TPA: glycosyltransferase family 1 protein [Terriglobales bacterium]|nr:glycosyltransferase family 1 protein [Terriglobales bacterium]
MIYADQRWIGNHGIGRFARNVLPAIRYTPISLGGNPAAPLDTWRLSRALKNLTREDLFFSPGYNAPLFCPSAFIFSIHDLSHIYCAENSSALIRLYYETIAKRACHQAAAVLTVSEFTRLQILEWAGIPSDKVINVSCGVDAAYCPEGDTYGFLFPYLLCVSNRKPHKNESRLVMAFARAKVSAMHLVFTGEPSPAIMRCIEKERVKDRVRFTGSVPETELPALYRGADALVFPSLYEGFGLPVLEAMACGTPVVTASTTAMPEVSAEAALLVDPTSVEQIANAIEKVVGDKALRLSLRQNGLARAAQFSWSRTNELINQVLSSVKP